MIEAKLEHYTESYLQSSLPVLPQADMLVGIPVIADCETAFDHFWVLHFKKT